MNLKRFLTSLGLLLSGITASAQVAVYEMEFEREPRSINFTFFDGGLFVMDGLTGSGSFIFTFQGVVTNQLEDLYIVSENTAEAFTAIKGNQRKIVVRASAETNTALSHYLAIGELEENISLQVRGQRIAFEIAPTIRGHVLISDDESDVDFPLPQDGRDEETLGFAGIATMRLSIDRPRTKEANINNLTVSETIAALVVELEEVGFLADSSTDDTTDTTTTTDDGTTDTTTTTTTTQ